MEIKQVYGDKRQYLNLLLLADEQEDMIDRYLESGEMYVLDDNGVRCVCVVTDNGDGQFEIKNIAVDSQSQRRGYGHQMLEYIKTRYRRRCTQLIVGTGDSPLTLPFYNKCGFKELYRIKNYFPDHYDHPIFEAGAQLIDMVVLSFTPDSKYNN